MDREAAVGLVRHMVEIPSLAGQERVLALCLVREMDRLGFKSYLDGAGNAVGEIGDAEGPLIMLLGHMDTVPGPVEVRQEGRLLYGRGTVDAKGALAAFVCAAAAAAAAGGRPDGGGFPARLAVVGAVEEETPGSRGAHYLLDRWSPDAVIIGEPSGWSNVVIGYKGRVGLAFSVTRTPAHDAAGGQNAVEAAVAFWAGIVRHLEAVGGDERIFFRPTATLRRLEGGAEAASLEVSCRVPPGFDAAAFQAALAASRGDGRLDFTEVTPAALMPRAASPARALGNAIRRHGGPLGLRVKTGTSDMNIVAQRWPAPMAAYGPGDSTLDHTSHEHIDLDEYLTAVDVLRDALGNLAAELAAARHHAAPRQVAPTGAPPMGAPPTQEAFTPEEEAELAKRLQALGYLE